MIKKKVYIPKKHCVYIHYQNNQGSKTNYYHKNTNLKE